MSDQAAMARRRDGARADGRAAPRGRDLVKHFPIKRGHHLRPAGRRRARRRRRLASTSSRGETLGLVGESGCGKSTPGAPDPAAARADLRLGPFEGQRDRRAVAQGAQAAAARDADDLPGPLLVAQPAQARRARSSATRCASTASSTAASVKRRGPGADGAGRAQPRALQPLPARVLRRPAPAHRDRAGARAEAEADRRRRAGLRARRLDPGADHQPARRPPGRVRAHLRLRRPRPLRRAPRLRPDRGHVPRQDRRARRRPTRSTTTRSTRTRSRCCRRCRSPTRAPTRPASRSSSRATCRAPRTRRRRAASTPRCPKATEICSDVEPPLIDYGHDHWAACHHPVGHPDPKLPAPATAPAA